MTIRKRSFALLAYSLFSLGSYLASPGTLVAEPTRLSNTSEHAEVVVEQFRSGLLSFQATHLESVSMLSMELLVDGVDISGAVLSALFAGDPRVAVVPLSSQSVEVNLLFDLTSFQNVEIRICAFGNSDCAQVTLSPTDAGYGSCAAPDQLPPTGEPTELLKVRAEGDCVATTDINLKYLLGVLKEQSLPKARQNLLACLTNEFAYFPGCGFANTSYGLAALEKCNRKITNQPVIIDHERFYDYVIAYNIFDQYDCRRMKSMLDRDGGVMLGIGLTSTYSHAVRVKSITCPPKSKAIIMTYEDYNFTNEKTRTGQLEIGPNNKVTSPDLARNYAHLTNGNGLRVTTYYGVVPSLPRR